MSLVANDAILVLGGTGELGSEIIKDLVAAGKRVTALARRTSSRELLEDLDISYAVGDMLIGADMKRVFTDTLYGIVIDASSGPYRDMANASHELLGAQTFYEESQKIISKWAAETGVQHLILHSTVGAGDSADLVNVENVFEVQRLALASKNIAEKILVSSGVPYTIIRHLTVLPLTYKESGKALLSKDRNKAGAITRDGLARLTLECLANKGCINKIFHAIDDEVELPDEIIDIWRQALKPEYMPDYVGTYGSSASTKPGKTS